jgi:electron transfer flavoprotein beta subunit
MVCIKPVLDPDLPPIKFSIDSKKNSVIPPEGMPPVMNPYDAVAVEAALQIKDKMKGKVTVISLGSGEDVLRKALAMGADEAIVIKADGVEEFDAFGKAALLAQAIKKAGAFELILCGRQAADWDVGATGSIIAENLGIPVLTRAKKIEALDGTLNMERISANGNETYETGLPALITVSSEMGKARIPSGWGIIQATKKPISTWTQADLGDVGKAAGKNTLLKLYAASNERKCEMIKGENAADAAGKLAGVIVDIIGK